MAPRNRGRSGVERVFLDIGGMRGPTCWPATERRFSRRPGIGQSLSTPLPHD